MSDVNLGTAMGLIQFVFDGAGAAAAVNSLTDLTGRFSDTSAGARNLGLGMAAAGAAIGDALSHAVGDALNYQQQIAQIGVTTNVATESAQQNAAQLKQVQAGLSGIAQTTPVSISGINAVAEALAQQGLRGQDLVTATQQVINLNQLTGESTSNLITPITKLIQTQNLGAQGFTQYSGALFEANRQTTATIPNILDFQQKLEASSRALGLTAPQSLALAAALGAVPAQGRQVVTTINQLTEAFTTYGLGTKQQTLIAQIAFGQGADSAQKFADTLRADPLAAINAFLDGIGKLHESDAQLSAILDPLGIKQVRQQLQLANVSIAQKEAAGSGQTLAQITQEVSAAWDGQNVTQDAANKLYDTTSGQLGILRNTVTQAGIAFGNDLFPAIRVVTTATSDFFNGVEHLVQATGPLIPILAAVSAVVLTVGGGILVLGPRIASAAAAFGTLIGIKQADAESSDRVESANAGIEDGIGILIIGIAELNVNLAILVGNLTGLAANESNIIDETIMMAETMGVATSAMEAETAAADDLTVATDAEAASMTALIPIVGIAAAVVGTVLLGAMSGAKSSTDSLSRSIDQGLLTSLQNEKQSLQEIADQWLLTKLAQDGTLEGLKNFSGLSINDVVTFIAGTGDAAAAAGDKIYTAMSAVGTSGDTFVDPLYKKLTDLKTTFVDTSQAAADLAASHAALGDSSNAAAGATDNATSSIEAEAQGIQTLKQQMTDLTNAAKNYVQQEVAVDQAQNQVAASEQKVSDAAQNLADKSLTLDEINNKLVVDTGKVSDAEAKLATDEQALANARAQQASDLAKAQDELSNARNREHDDITTTQQAQLKLNDLQNGGAQLKYIQTINALHDAQTALLSSQQSVADAQDQLDFLIGQHAGGRDIEQARLAVAEANNKQADAAAKAQEAQQKVADLPTQQAVDLASAQNAVADSLQRQKDDADAVTAAELKVSQIQTDIANDTAYKKALEAIAQDHQNIDDAILSEHGDLQKLHDIQNGSLERAYKGAVDDLYTSVDQLATRQTDLEQTQALLNGDFWTAQDYANHFATNLGAVTTQAGLANTPLGTLDQTVQQLTGDVNALNGAILGNQPSPAGNIPSPVPGKPISQAALGGLTTSDGLLYVHSNEVILPLNDPARSYGLLSGSGLLDQIASYVSSSGKNISAPISTGTLSAALPAQQGGDSFHLTTLQGATAPEVVQEFTWKRLVRPNG